MSWLGFGFLFSILVGGLLIPKVPEHDAILGFLYHVTDGNSLFIDAENAFPVFLIVAGLIGPFPLMFVLIKGAHIDLMKRLFFLPLLSIYLFFLPFGTLQSIVIVFYLVTNSSRTAHP